MIPILTNGCCGKYDNKKCSLIISIIMLIFSIVFLMITIGLVAGWENFDTQFLDNKYNSSGNSIEGVRLEFQTEIRGVWKREFISLYCFLPWYALVNVLLMIGVKKEVKTFLLFWILFTIGFLIWSFVLVSILFNFNTTPGFLSGLAIAQLCNFALLISCILSLPRIEK